jgi:hypothetical protein
MRRHVAGLEMHPRHALEVTGDEAVEDFGEEAPLLQADPPGNAEIDGDDVMPAGSTNRLPWMHVGMEEAVAHGMAQEVLHHRVGELIEVVPCGAQPSISDILIPSTHSSVSTSRPVRCQSTFGTRKPGSSLVFSPSSESAAASSRRSISILVDCASVSAMAHRAQPPRGRERVFPAIAQTGRTRRDRARNAA